MPAARHLRGRPETRRDADRPDARHRRRRARPCGSRPSKQLAEPVDLLLVTVKSYGLDDGISRIEAEPGRRPAAAQRARAHGRPARARFANVVAATIGHFEGYRESPTRIVQQTPGVVNVAATEAPEQLERAGIATRAGGSEKDVLWEKLARQGPIAVLTSVARRDDRRAADRPAAAPGGRGSVRGRRSRRRHDDVRRAMGDHRVLAGLGHVVHGTRRHRRAAVRARRDRRRASSARAADSAFPHRRSKRLLAAMPSVIALIGARSGSERVAEQEHPAARRPPAARLRDRDGAAGGRVRARARLHRLRGDRGGRALVRRRRARSSGRRSTRPPPRRTSSGSRTRSSGCPRATTSSPSCARRTRSAARTSCGAASSSCSPLPRRTPSAPSSS